MKPLQIIWTKIRTYRMFDTVIIFLKEFFEKVNFEGSRQSTTIKAIKSYPVYKVTCTFSVVCLFQKVKVLVKKKTRRR